MNNHIILKYEGDEKMKTVTVKDETHIRLREAGVYGDSMDTIINRALDCLEKVKHDAKTL